MRQYGYLQSILMSFYSRNLYRDVAQNWGAGVVVYLFLVITLSWAVMMFQFQPAVNVTAANFTKNIVPQLPKKIIINKGIASTVEDRPYFIRDADTHEVIAVIDTTGKYNDLEEAEADFLMTKDSIIYLANKDTIKIQKIPNVDMEIKPVEYKHKIIKFAGWLWVLFLPFIILFSLVYRLLESLIYAFFGKIYDSLSRGPTMSYPVVLKLTMVALTPVIVIATIVDWSSFNLRHAGLIYFILAMFYLVFAIRANKVTGATQYGVRQ